MKRVIRDDKGRETTINVTWLDHISDNCPKCCYVDMSKPSTFAQACAEGSPLLMEHLVEVQRPEENRKQKAVLEWAKAAGVFKIGKHW